MKFQILLLFPLFLSSFAFAQADKIAGETTQVVLSDDSEGPTVLFDNSEITQAELAALDASQIGDIKILSGAEAQKKFGKYKKHGAIVVSSKAPADVITKANSVTTTTAPAEQIKSSTEGNVKMSFGADLNAHVIIDGQAADMKTLQAMSPSQIESMKVLKDDAAIKKYGDLAKDGAIEVVTRK